MLSLRSSRALVALLLAVLLAGRLVVPTGWMPVRTDDGGFSIMLCSGSGPAEGWIDSAGQLHKGHKPAGQSQGKSDPRDPCPFGATTAAITLPAAPAVAEALPIPAPPPARAGQAPSVGQGLAAPPPPATGPPLFA